MLRFAIALLLAAAAIPSSSALAASTPAHPPVIAPAIAALQGAHLTASQKQAFIQALYNRTLLVLDQLGRQTSGDERAVLLQAVGVALEKVLTQTDLLSDNDSDAANKIVRSSAESVFATGAALVAANKGVAFDEFARAVNTLGLFWLLLNEPPPAR